MNKFFSKTELPFYKTEPIDHLSPEEAIDLIISEQIEGLKILNKNKNRLKKIIDIMHKHLQKCKNGRLIYCGAGTSGRIAVQDGAELYPTFGWPKARFRYIIAGGKKALTSSIEGAEDDKKTADKEVEKLKVNSNDIIIGLSASGNTPFTCNVINAAKKSNALTLSISNNSKGKINFLSDYNLVLDTEAEVIAGSTRLKAGTAQKVCLNIISSMIMIKFGFVKYGLMNKMVPLNKKLIERKKRINSFYKNLYKD